MNAQQAAEFLGAHVETVRRLARKSGIPAFKVGKDWRFRREALVRWADGDHLRRQPPRILVVDDEQAIRNLAKRLLETEGYQVSLASGGAEGLTRLDSEAISLILLDLKMPVMNGPAFLERMQEAGYDIPVIIVTGYPDSELVAEAMRHGPITLIAKPIDRQKLMQTVSRELRGAREAQGPQ